MRQWEHGGGSSIDAGVRIEAANRKGLESRGQRLARFGAPRTQRLLRYCARPFAGERLAWAKPGQRLAYFLPKPRPDGQLVLYLTPLEWRDAVVLLIPPPRRHRHRYHGVLARNAPLGAAVTARAGLPVTGPLSLGVRARLSKRLPRRERRRTKPRPNFWAMLLARIFKARPRDGTA
jgi:hypothetical protein